MVCQSWHGPGVIMNVRKKKKTFLSLSHILGKTLVLSRKIINKKKGKAKIKQLLSLRVELKTSRLLNGCSNQLSYESLLVIIFMVTMSSKPYDPFWIIPSATQRVTLKDGHLNLLCLWWKQRTHVITACCMSDDPLPNAVDQCGMCIIRPKRAYIRDANSISFHRQAMRILVGRAEVGCPWISILRRHHY